jgi:hypothetical protein
LRIFFEREVKTKYTPTNFGSTFKGSKWVDYQTFNINKLFIKTGLYYFYYIFTILLLVFMFLGRSKSEQYFGFLPFFTYINFIIGYVPLVCSDITSQVITIGYVLYTFIYKIFYTFLGRLVHKTLVQEIPVIGPKYSINNIKNPLDINLQKLFNNQNNLFGAEFSKIPLVSKTLTSVKNNITSIKKLPDHNKTSYVNNSIVSESSVIKTKIIKTFSNNKRSVSSSEASYSYSFNSLNTKNHNNVLTLKELNVPTNTPHYPLTFSFNLKQNLNTSYQQRWLTKNSLLTESLVNNSFLITQVKKVIGMGVLNNDFSKKSLWLPSQSTKLSTAESYLQLNNVLRKSNSNYSFLLNSQLNNPNFTNINFFENSRFFLAKKYFFTNNISNNLVSLYSKVIGNSCVKLTTLNPTQSKLSTNTYTNNLSYLIINSNTPSLYAHTKTRNTFSSTNYLNNLVTLNTPNLDIINSSNTQFFFTLTSNLSKFNNTKYFNSINHQPYYNNYGQIKFYK